MFIKITNLDRKIFSAIDAIVKSPRLQNVRSLDFFNKRSLSSECVNKG